MIRAVFFRLLFLLASAGMAWGQGGQYTPIAHQYLTGFNAYGRPIGAQPQIIDLSDASTISSMQTTVNGITSAWTAYTPTLACSTGSLTTASAIGRYKQNGKTVLINIIITITTNGSCAGWIVASLPVAGNQESVLAGRDDGVTGGMLQGIIGNQNTDLSHFLIFFYNEGYPGANGAKLVLTGVYESQ
jgi:hypothetical protein